MRCRVKDCENYDHQGNGVVILVEADAEDKFIKQWVCSPCWWFITRATRESVYSQACRNATEILKARGEVVEKQDLRELTEAVNAVNAMVERIAKHEKGEEGF